MLSISRSTKSCEIWTFESNREQFIKLIWRTFENSTPFRERMDLRWPFENLWNGCIAHKLGKHGVDGATFEGSALGSIEYIWKKAEFDSESLTGWRDLTVFGFRLQNLVYIEFSWIFNFHNNWLSMYKVSFFPSPAKRGSTASKNLE